MTNKVCFPYGSPFEAQKKQAVKDAAHFLAKDEVAIFDFFSVLDAMGEAGMRSEAFALLENKASSGSIRAQTHLGDYYKKGYMELLIVQNHGKSVEYYRLAASKNDSYAINALGEAYENGLGVPQNYQETLKFYRMAAQRHNPYAMDNLATLYSSGKIQRDLVRAYIWFNLSAAGFTSIGGTYNVGIGQAIAAKRDRVAQMLTNAQLQDAQNRSTACAGSAISKCD